MTLSVLQLVLMLLAAAGCAAVAGFFGAVLLGKHRYLDAALSLQAQADEAGAQLDEAEQRVDEVSAQLEKAISDRNKLAEWSAGAKAKMSAMKDEVAKANAQASEYVGKAKALAGTVEALRAEREDTKASVTRLQKALVTVHQRTLSMQREFEKAGESYKRELAKSLEIRQRLEKEVSAAVKDRESFHKRMQKSVEEHGSEKEMLEAAHLRLGQIDLLERNNAKLRLENTGLQEELEQAREEFDALKRQVAEIDELRIHNKQLVQAVELLEQSRAHHEQEAEQYRDKADQLSASLKMKLSDIEESFAAMEQEQNEAIKIVRSATASAVPAANGEHGSVPGLVGTA